MGMGRGQALRYIVLGNCHGGGGASIRQGAFFRQVHIIQTLVVFSLGRLTS